MWTLHGKVEDRKEPIDEGFFDKINISMNKKEIEIQLVDKTAQKVLSEKNWMCSSYNNTRIKSKNDLTDKEISGFIQHTITQSLINWYIDNNKQFPNNIEACAIIAKDMEVAAKIKNNGLTNNFIFFICFRPDPKLSKDEMNNLWKYSGYALFPLNDGLEMLTNNSVSITESINIVPINEGLLSKDQAKEIAKDSLRYAAFGAAAEDNIDKYVKYGKNESLAKLQIKNSCKTKGALRDISIKSLDKHFTRLRNTTLSKQNGYDKRLKELEDYYKSLKNR